MWTLFMETAYAQDVELADAAQDFLYTVVVGTLGAIVIAAVLIGAMRAFSSYRERRRLDEEAERRNQRVSNLDATQAGAGMRERTPQEMLMEQATPLPRAAAAPAAPAVVRTGGAWGDPEPAPPSPTMASDTPTGGLPLEQLLNDVPWLRFGSLVEKVRAICKFSHDRPGKMGPWLRDLSPMAARTALASLGTAPRQVVSSTLAGIDLTAEPPTLDILFTILLMDGRPTRLEERWTVSLDGSPMKVTAIERSEAYVEISDKPLNVDPNLEAKRAAFLQSDPTHDWQDFDSKAEGVIKKVLAAMKDKSFNDARQMLTPGLFSEVTASATHDPESPLGSPFELVGFRTLQLATAPHIDVVAIGVVGVDGRSQTVRQVWTVYRARDAAWKVLLLDTASSWVD